MSRWIRLAHFDEIDPTIMVGKFVTPTTKAGKCGDTGHVTGPHVHIDGTWGRPKFWTQYVRGWFQEQIKKVYFDTLGFARLILPYPRMFFTSKWLTWDGSVWHPGYDVNVLPEDKGLDVFCGVYGCVQYVGKSSVLRKFMTRWFRLTLNSGWGNYFWIEIDESKYL